MAAKIEFLSILFVAYFGAVAHSTPFGNNNAVPSNFQTVVNNGARFQSNYYAMPYGAPMMPNFNRFQSMPPQVPAYQSMSYSLQTPATPQVPMAYLPPTPATPIVNGAPAAVPAAVPAAPTAPAQTPYNIIQDPSYTDCQIIEVANQPNQIYPTGFARCRPGAQCYGGNNIRSQLFLDTNAIWRGSCKIPLGTRVTVGARSIIGTGISFYKMVEFGSDCQVGNGGLYHGSTVGNNVILGNEVSLQGEIKDNVRISDFVRTSSNTVINSGAKIGRATVIFSGAQVAAGIEIGEMSCIGSDARVDKNLKPWTLYNRDGVARERIPGEDVITRNGDCEHI